MVSKSFKVCLWSFLTVSGLLYAEAGKVYLVLGSDTAIWDGMSTSRFNCTYNLSLYTDPTRNAAKVMDASWRLTLRDSYGTPMKLTWWMMAGNIFRYATNHNMPIPNIMTLYLMQKYYGAFISEVGDELSLHYHTFVWTDYDQDGVWYWNQAKDFNESREDFDFTLCQFLLEENIFPVSFRSGWHYMDNHWQNYLDELLPFSMHNDWPNKRTTDPEPIDNIYDWSRSPAAFIPWHPSKNDYRLPGDGPGWNVRSLHLNTARSRNILDSLFYKANQGVDQVACIWGHLPEEDFLTNLVAIDSLAHRAAAKYPNVTFRYCSAIEAMQRWLGQTDTIPPTLTFEELPSGEDIYFRIQTDEPIFQPQPYLAIKDIYENYYKVPCQAIGPNQWQSTKPIPRAFLAKVGVAVCDSLGNQSKAFINFLPDDIYLDNAGDSYQELRGTWQTVNDPNYWNKSIRTCHITTDDSVVAAWQFTAPQTCLYKIFTQIPTVSNPASVITYQVLQDNNLLASKSFVEGLTPDDWNYLTTLSLQAQQTYTIRLVVYGKGNENKTVVADVLKISALVRPKDLVCETREINYGEVGQLDTATINLKLYNEGYLPLTISRINCPLSNVLIETTYPLQIQPMSSLTIPIRLSAEELGSVSDTVFIYSDDPIEPVVKLPLTALVTPHFLIIDNEHQGKYFEYGTWKYSVAQAYGPTSRYAPLNQNPYAYARFVTTAKLDGVYDLYEIVPTTVNASNKALYTVRINGVRVDSFYVDQNAGSGNWVKISSNLKIRCGDQIEVKVADTGLNTNAGAVLRADAVKFAWTNALGQGLADNISLPQQFELHQNYPNPCNASTIIQYAVPSAGKVQIVIYDMLGRVVAKPVDSPHQPGYYSTRLDLSPLSSGFYFYQLTSGSTVLVKKLLLIK